MDEKDICVTLLAMFQLGKNIKRSDIENLKVHTSQRYALGPVLAFNYNGKHYYAVDDYSLADDPVYVDNILSEINHLLKGRIVENPTSQKDGAKYAAKLHGSEYYLWESPLT